MNTDPQPAVRSPFLDRPGTAFAWALGLIVFSIGLSFACQDSSYFKVAMLSFLSCLPAFLLFAFTDVYGFLDRDILAETLKKPKLLKRVRIIGLCLVEAYSLMFGLIYFAATSLAWSTPPKIWREHRIWPVGLNLALYFLLVLRLPFNTFLRKTNIQLVIVFLIPFLVKILFYPCVHLRCWIELPLYAGLSSAGYYLFLKLSLRFARYHIIRTNWSDKRSTLRFNQVCIQLLPE